jgi:hypothetical protein
MQVGGLVLVIAVGLPHVGEIDLLAGPGLGGLLSAGARIFFAFIGRYGPLRDRADRRVVSCAHDLSGCGSCSPA